MKFELKMKLCGSASTARLLEAPAESPSRVLPPRWHNEPIQRLNQAAAQQQQQPIRRRARRAATSLASHTNSGGGGAAVQVASSAEPPTSPSPFAVGGETGTILIVACFCD